MRNPLPQFRNIATRTAFWMGFVVGIFLLGHGLYDAIPSMLLTITGVAAEGKVIENENGVFPVIEFQNAEGHKVIFRSPFGSGPPEFDLGESVPVIYDPRSPDNSAAIRSFGHMWAEPLAWLIAGLLVACGSFLVANKQYPALFSLVGLVIGVGVLWSGSAELLSAIHLDREGAPADGKVVRVEHSHPVVEFETVGGRRVTFTGVRDNLQQDQTVAVLYDPDHPRHASIQTLGQMWSGPVLAVAIGLAFTVLPLVIAYIFYHPILWATFPSILTVMGGLLVLGILCLGYGAVTAVRSFRLEASGAQAVGKVIHNEYDGETHFPVVEFHTSDGRRIVFTSSHGSEPKAYEEGDTVTVLYPPEHPERGTIWSFSELWLLPLVLGVIGLICVTIPVVSWRTGA